MRLLIAQIVCWLLGHAWLLANKTQQIYCERCLVYRNQRGARHVP